MKKTFTGERLETFIYDANAIKHLHRYSIAANFVKGKVVLDIASGEGYGSNLMSYGASFVYGVDIDNKAIEKAKIKYRRNNIQFVVGDTRNIPLEDKSVDVVISYETIEHHAEHEKMLQEIKRVLRPNGISIISTPDKYFYSDVRNYKNEFHVKELYKTEFIDLIKKYFFNYQILTQSYLNGNSIVLDEINRNTIEFYTGDYASSSKICSPPQFMIAIASNSLFKKQNNSVYDGTLILRNNLNCQEKLDRVYNSNPYKIGQTLLSPIKFLKKLRF
ncbi:class I SAM-dependent methyltransferase [Antarcticibacterium arcticum]|uniref:Class I SAM-dependent methyltransferase n=1 Tax=Antarcticibacterium arcticum TaxID=2585771 RepID=A0A5B8YIJ4_9FLAO|nr:class I SAM-dependent methyltransferase [Antarcticibacterium arcticum]QED37770.1 class I SAM-dependent methyltransferase [Antarcticibacterium arcticum]